MPRIASRFHGDRSAKHAIGGDGPMLLRTHPGTDEWLQKLLLSAAAPDRSTPAEPLECYSR